MKRVWSAVSGMLSLTRSSPATNERGGVGAEGVAGQEVFGVAVDVVAGAEFGAGVGRAAAEDGGGGCVGSVDHRGVDEGGGEVGLLARVVGVGAGGGVEEGAVELDGLAGGVDVIAGGDGEVDELGGAGVGAIGVVGEEVSKGVDVAGESAVVGRAPVGA
jgi:hypothetical protein